MRRIESNPIKPMVIILLLLLSSCVKNNNNSVNANEPTIRVLDSLSQSFNKDTLSVAVAKIDSILSYDENKNDGYYYYMRGYCNTALGNYEKAIRDLMISQEMDYKTDKSIELIEYNKGLQENERKYAPYR